MRLVFVVLLASLFSETLANLVFAQDSVEQITDSPPNDVIVQPKSEEPPDEGQKIPTEEDKLKLFCEIAENKDNTICRN